MKRLLLSAGLIGVVFAGYPPHPLQTNQLTSAAADQSNDRAVSIVPKSRTVQRVAFNPSDVAARPEQATNKGSPLEPTIEEMFKPALLETPQAKYQSKDEAVDENVMWMR